MWTETATKNGRCYRWRDTGLPYENESGGILLTLFHNGQWVYLDNAPDLETLAWFFKLAEKLPKA